MRLPSLPAAMGPRGRPQWFAVESLFDFTDASVLAVKRQYPSSTYSAEGGGGGDLGPNLTYSNLNQRTAAAVAT